MARMYGVVPISIDDTSVELLAVNPFNHSIVDDLTFTLNRDVISVGDPDSINALIVSTYGEGDASIDDILSDLDDGPQKVVEEELSEADLENLANDQPIIRFVNLVLQQAIKDKASDIHFEPFEDESESVIVLMVHCMKWRRHPSI